MKIEVTQADMECARNIRNAWDVNCDTASEIAAQHRILATRTDATPDSSLHNVIHGEHGWRRREVQRIGAAISTRNWHDLETTYNELRDKMDRTTKPHPPATDVAALVEAAKAMGDDYMTSEHHHPRYVLVPTVAFEQMRQALAPFTKGQP